MNRLVVVSLTALWAPPMIPASAIAPVWSAITRLSAPWPAVVTVPMTVPPTLTASAAVRASSPPAVAVTPSSEKSPSSAASTRVTVSTPPSKVAASASPTAASPSRSSGLVLPGATVRLSPSRPAMSGRSLTVTVKLSLSLLVPSVVRTVTVCAPVLPTAGV